MNKIEKTIEHSYLEKIEYIISNINKSEIPNILIVDANKEEASLLNMVLAEEYNVITTSNANEALQILKENNNISIIISDNNLPDKSGTELFESTLKEYPDIMRILISDNTDINTLLTCINKCELFKFLIKPIHQDEFKEIIKEAIASFERANNKNSIINDLKELFFTTIKSISSAIDAKDAYTHGHSYRVTLYALILANELGLDKEMMEDIETTGLLHDVGKIGVSESILCKPGKLTDEEFAIMKSHPEQGKKMVQSIDKLQDVAHYVNCHHERWDGRGYPHGFKEDETPFISRIIGIADTYDAMTSSRSYRKKLPHKVAKDEIEKCSGSQFDPELAEAFLRVEKIFEKASENPVEYYEHYSILHKIVNSESY